jgi:hypothetical protein
VHPIGGNSFKRHLAALLSVTGLAFCAQAGSALGAQYHVNGATGADTNSCLQASAGAPPLGPCLTIDHALDLAQANPGADEVLVADGTYPETLLVINGTQLRTLDTSDPKPVINNSPAPPTTSAVTIGGGGSIAGFEIRSDYVPLVVSGTTTLTNITNNAFPTTTAPSGLADVLLNAATGAVVISGNEFSDDGIGAQSGVVAMATGATTLTVQNNDFSGLATGVWLQSGGGSPLIADNRFTGTHENNGSALVVYQGSPVVRHNTIEAAGSGTPSGIYLTDTNGPAGATMSRNTITGLTTGLLVADTPLPVTLNGDVITGNGYQGVQAVDISGGRGDVTATNVTIFDNADADFYLQDANLTLDSSIVEDITRVATGSCAIGFSRGSATGTPGVLTDCNDFQTTAAPLFVGAGNYHLQAASTMIDAGNPLAPGAGVLDVDGQPRALDATPACSGNVDRRDIGADEFAPPSLPPGGCAVNPGSPSAKKKCAKGRKLKKGQCVKSKRKKKR